MASNAIRCNISLPFELLEKIDKACEELGCARSVYIAMAVRAKLDSDAMFEHMPQMVSMMHDMMQVAKKADVFDSADGSSSSVGGRA